MLHIPHLKISLSAPEYQNSCVLPSFGLFALDSRLCCSVCSTVVEHTLNETRSVRRLDAGLHELEQKLRANAPGLID